MKHSSRLGDPWVLSAVVVVVVATFVLSVVAFVNEWGTDRVNALAASASGALTLVGLLYALREARLARVDAEKGRIDADERARAEQSEVEFQRRITLEIQQRIRGADATVFVLDTMTHCQADLAQILRLAAQDMNNMEMRNNHALDINIRWTRDRPLIGARILQIATSKFAHVLAGEALPTLDRAIEDAQSALATGNLDAIFTAVVGLGDDEAKTAGDKLREAALEDFTLDMDSIREKVERDMTPPTQEPA